MVSKGSSRIYDAVVGYFGAEGSFTQFICPKQSMDRRTLAEVGTELSIEYIIPPSVCQQSTGNGQTFSVSAILALLDEFSTYALMIQDKNHRPGVSVTLNIEIIKASYVGEKVRLVSRCDKIGKSIAFLSMEIQSAKGELLARGKHIKYVKMGFVWDLLTNFFLFPLMLAILEYLVSSSKKKNTVIASNETPTFQPDHIFTVLSLEAANDPHSLFVDNCSSAAKGKRKSKRAIVPVFADGESCFTLRVNRSLSNVLGAMHGGAIAAAGEEASRRHNAKATGGASAPVRVVDKMEVTYKAPAKVRMCACLCNFKN